MSEIIDITLTLDELLPVWPGSSGFQLEQYSKIESGDEANVSRIRCDAHVGTHVDAPCHHIVNGIDVESLDLCKMLGLAHVVELSGIKEIKRQHLESLVIPDKTRRLLIKTDNSHNWTRQNTKFDKDYVALTECAADWIVRHNIDLIGIDYLSVQRYSDSSSVHKILLEAEIVILEGINLAVVDPGDYELICLPLKIKGADGAPSRALLRTLN